MMSEEETTEMEPEIRGAMAAKSSVKNVFRFLAMIQWIAFHGFNVVFLLYSDNNNEVPTIG